MEGEACTCMYGDIMIIGHCIIKQKATGIRKMGIKLQKINRRKKN
jgi:hypothetical protein